MATERNSRNTTSANRSGSTNRTSSANRNGRRRVSKAELKRRQRKKWIILGIEFFVVFILIIALFFITKLDVIHKDYIDEDEIQTNENVNSEEMLEEFLISEEDVKFNNISDDMQGYRNIALFGVDARNNNLGKGVRSDTIIIASINEETKEIHDFLSLNNISSITYKNKDIFTTDEINEYIRSYTLLTCFIIFALKNIKRKSMSYNTFY